MISPRAILSARNLPPALVLSGLLGLGLFGPRSLIAEESAAEKTAAPVAAPAAHQPNEASSTKPVDGAFERPTAAAMAAAQTDLLNNKLELARSLRLNSLAAQAEPSLVELLADENPEAIRQSALLELALCAQDRNDLPRAQQIYSQFHSRWPNDARTPEILLRQGQFFRQMGLNSMALTKFYGVMTAALALKTDKLDYYKRIVTQSQNEIAETHFQMGKFADAADYFSRLLKQNNPLLDRSLVQYRLLRALSELRRHEEAMGQAQDFLTRFPEASERAEVRFLIAHSLKELGRNNEALQQVLALLQEQKKQSSASPEVWAYWQQRAGNEIANQLYREGDYTKALDVYMSLAQLDSTPAWQIPVQYQLGMTYEKLQQPQLASQTYSNIISRELTTGTNASPGLKSVFDMARWRITFLDWQVRAENSTREFSAPPRTPTTPADPHS